MLDLLRKHYGKLLALLAGWAAEALVDLTSYVQAVLAAVSRALGA